MTRRLNQLLACLLIVFGIPFYWYFLSSGTGGGQAYPLSIRDLRHLAGDSPNARPEELRHEIVGYRSITNDLIIAGTGIKDTRLAVRAFQIIWSDGRSAIIDRGISNRRGKAKGMDVFDQRAQSRVDEAVRTARFTIALVQPAQGESALGGRPAKRGDAPTGELAPFAAAPGVVVIPTPDIRHGMRMVYVRLKDGREFLLTGDVAPVRANWSELAPPARYFTDIQHHFDRRAMINWLMTIKAVHAQAPGMTVVEGYDPRVPAQTSRGFVH